MSSEEEDYMSDAFLLGSAASVRPGLVPDKIAKQYKKEEKIKQLNLKSKTKPLKEKEKEHREEGLQNELSSDNKGFALLQKMGYKKGMGLGKQGTGRSVPVPIEIKTGRGGLGREALLKRKQENAERLHRERMAKRVKDEEREREDYRDRTSTTFIQRLMDKDLFQSQKACEHLDRQKNLEEPVEKWYWPTYPKLEEEEKEEESEEESDESDEEPVDDISVEEKLCTLTNYLRKQYLYCVWCGTAYNDEKDLNENCPGDTAKAHD
ncbi:G patch domain-containing protein 11-like [Saccoglossus kowalevskii]